MTFLYQLALILLLVFLNGFFVASEFALVAVRRTRIDLLAKQGNKQAKLVQKTIAHLDTFISTTQLGITLASLALGWIGEPAIAGFLAPFVKSIVGENLAILSANGLAIILAFTLISFFQIVLGELAPKTIALQKAEFIALLIITPISIFATVFKPFIWTLNKAGRIVLNLVGFHAPLGRQLGHSEEEIKMILAQSAEEGTLEKEEVEMVYSVFKLGDLSVKGTMIPKSKIIAFEKNTAILNVIKTTQKYQHSRFPVYDTSLDSIIGFVHIKDIYINLVSDKTITSVDDIDKSVLKMKSEKTLSQLKIIRKIPHVKESDRIDDVLVLLRRKQIHIAVVENEKGDTAGIVALEDMVENLVGEIKDEFDEAEKEIVVKN